MVDPSRLKLLLFAAVIAAATFGIVVYDNRASVAVPRLDAAGLATLRDDFNASADAVRVIVLLSPT
ncbi:MAG TPA: hypothetical protein VHJ77_13750 [Vicinamibacterales bacterium]|jgi:hypothetical protein|nr:hypothetical protein [Vicinamibacterales bacterium]